jgi:hypothetical protein
MADVKTTRGFPDSAASGRERNEVWSLRTRPKPSAVKSAAAGALFPSCAECEAGWLPADEDRWSAYLTDDEPPELAFYCAECAEREFGDD